MRSGRRARARTAGVARLQVPGPLVGVPLPSVALTRHPDHSVPHTPPVSRAAIVDSDDTVMKSGEADWEQFHKIFVALAQLEQDRCAPGVLVPPPSAARVCVNAGGGCGDNTTVSQGQSIHPATTDPPAPPPHPQKSNKTYSPHFM